MHRKYWFNYNNIYVSRETAPIICCLSIAPLWLLALNSCRKRQVLVSALVGPLVAFPSRPWFKFQLFCIPKVVFWRRLLYRGDFWSFTSGFLVGKCINIGLRTSNIFKYLQTSAALPLYSHAQWQVVFRLPPSLPGKWEPYMQNLVHFLLHFLLLFFSFWFVFSGVDSY
jgi:hypothetical protein